MHLGCGLRRSEAVALAMGYVERWGGGGASRKGHGRHIACRLPRAMSGARRSGHRIARRAPSRRMNAWSGQRLLAARVAHPPAGGRGDGQRALEPDGQASGRAKRPPCSWAAVTPVRGRGGARWPRLAAGALAADEALALDGAPSPIRLAHPPACGRGDGQRAAGDGAGGRHRAARGAALMMSRVEGRDGRWVHCESARQPAPRLSKWIPSGGAVVRAQSRPGAAFPVKPARSPAMSMTIERPVHLNWTL